MGGEGATEITNAELGSISASDSGAGGNDSDAGGECDRDVEAAFDNSGGGVPRAESGKDELSNEGEGVEDILPLPIDTVSRMSPSSLELCLAAVIVPVN